MFDGKDLAGFQSCRTSECAASIGSVFERVLFVGRVEGLRSAVTGNNVLDQTYIVHTYWRRSWQRMSGARMIRRL